MRTTTSGRWTPIVLLGFLLPLLLADVGDAAPSAEDPSLARISGRVVDERGRPVADMVVAVADVLPVPTGLPVVTRTRADGTYSIAVQPGVFRVQVRHFEASFAYRRPFVEKWWPNALTYADAADVVVRPGSVVRGVDIVLQKGARIRGRAVGPGGAPVRFGVSLNRWDGRHWQWFDSGRWVAEDDSGRFEVSGLPPGRYRLTGFGEFEDLCSSQNALTGPTITVRAGQVVEGRRIDLEPMGSIHGVVHPLDPAIAHHVTLWRLTGEHGWTQDSPVSLGPDGTFRFDNLCAGRYRLSFGSPVEYWNNQGDFDSADDILVTPGSDTAISAVLDPGGTITGRLLFPDEVPAVWTSVSAYRRTGGGSWEHVGGGGTADDGTFEITDLRPGTYRLRLGTTADRDRLPIVEEFWPDSPDLEHASDVVVSSPLSNIAIGDAHVAVGAEVWGEVREATPGATVGSAPVTLYQISSGKWRPVDRQPTVHRTGQYHFYGLEPGRYRLGVVDSTFHEHAPEFWPAAHHLTGARTFLLSRGEVRQLDFDLDLGVRNLAAPRIRGSAEVGRRLRVDPRMWSPYRTRFEFQWLANGRPIRGAHSKAFQLRPRDAGKRLSVRVTGTHPGYVRDIATSAKTRRVRG